jgi:transposase
MARGKEIPESIRNQIVGMRKVGTTYTEIAHQLNINKNTAKDIYDRYQERGTCENAPRPGRPTKLDERDIRAITRHIRRDRETRRQALPEIITDLNLPVCPKTLHKTLIKYTNFRHRIERSSPHLTSQQKAARLAFAKKHIKWGPVEWGRVAFTDEMGMQTSSNSGKKFVWRYPEEEFLEDCCAATVIPGFQKVKIWGAMRCNKLSNLVVLPERKGDGKFNSQEYVEVIMDGEMFDFWMEGMEDVGYLIMMEDGARYHEGVATHRRKQLEEDGWIGWGPKTWPSNSPDLNPIENLWHVLRSNIRKRKVQAKTKAALIVALQEEWRKLDLNIVNTLINSMPKRLQAVIKAKGGYSGY